MFFKLKKGDHLFMKNRVIEVVSTSMATTLHITAQKGGELWLVTEEPRDFASATFGHDLPEECREGAVDHLAGILKGANNARVSELTVQQSEQATTLSLRYTKTSYTKSGKPCGTWKERLLEYRLDSTASAELEVVACDKNGTGTWSGRIIFNGNAVKLESYEDEASED